VGGKAYRPPAAQCEPRPQPSSTLAYASMADDRDTLFAEEGWAELGAGLAPAPMPTDFAAPTFAAADASTTGALPRLSTGDTAPTLSGWSDGVVGHNADGTDKIGPRGYASGHSQSTTFDDGKLSRSDRHTEGVGALDAAGDVDAPYTEHTASIGVEGTKSTVAVGRNTKNGTAEATQRDALSTDLANGITLETEHARAHGATRDNVRTRAAFTADQARVGETHTYAAGEHANAEIGADVGWTRDEGYGMSVSTSTKLVKSGYGMSTQASAGTHGTSVQRQFSQQFGDPDGKASGSLSLAPRFGAHWRLTIDDVGETDVFTDAPLVRVVLELNGDAALTVGGVARRGEARSSNQGDVGGSASVGLHGAVRFERWMTPAEVERYAFALGQTEDAGEAAGGEAEFSALADLAAGVSAAQSAVALLDPRALPPGGAVEIDGAQRAGVEGNVGAGYGGVGAKAGGSVNAARSRNVRVEAPDAESVIITVTEGGQRWQRRCAVGALPPPSLSGARGATPG
jgi:hypothetical protein